MKKSFYFVLALTAGLFASCSSDELTSQAPQGAFEINDNEPALITIGVPSVGVNVTRGTGTVGGFAAANAWEGQKFNLFMFEKGTLTPAQKTVKVGGVDTNVDIFNNAELTAPNDPAGTNPDGGKATYVINGEEQFNYYPTTGVFSFWAYRADDAADTEDADGDPTTPETPIVKQTDDTGDEAAATKTQVRIPFTIDGSQDIMLATPDVDAAKTSLINYSTTDAISTDAQAEEKIYTAFSARRNVFPKLVFDHALTRLTFQVKTNDIQVSDHADLVGTADYRGFKVTGISVKSLSKGYIVAANLSGNQSVVFDNTLAKVAMPLKSRSKAVKTVEQGEWSGKVTLNITSATASDCDGKKFDFPTESDVTIVASDPAKSTNLLVYTTNENDEYSGKPVESPMTLGDAIAKAWADNGNAATTLDVYQWAVKTAFEEADPVGGVVPDAPGSSKLIALTPVVPAWEDATGSAITVAYAWEAISQALYDDIVAADGTKKIADVADNTSTSAAAALAAYELANPAASTGGGTDPVNPGKVVKIDGTNLPGPVYLLCTEKFAGGQGKATKIGEALLVAPNEGSYELTLTYKRWKKTSANEYSESEGSVVKTFSKASSNSDFEAAHSYNVVITLYSDGSADTDTELKPWIEDGTDINVDGED